MTKKFIYYFGPKFRKFLKKSDSRCLKLFIQGNSFLPNIIKERAAILLTKIEKTKFVKSRLKRFCMFSGRLRFPLSKLKLSRMLVKIFAGKKFLVGIKKK